MKKEGKNQVWQDYQKEIADNHYFYVRSCIRQNFFPGSEEAFLRILRSELNKDIYETPHHTSCSGIGYHSDVIPFETIQTIVARQFALMTEAGYQNLAVSCITSFGIYNEIIETWKEFPEALAKTRYFLKKATGREFEIPMNVSHASDIIYKFRNEIAARKVNNLTNCQTGKPLRIVEHIGCHYAKIFPSKGVGGAEFPYVLAGMIETWGGEVVDYPERRHCCGFGFRQYLVQSNRGYSLSNSRKKFESMEPFKPDAILCNCPGCPMFLDRWQYVIQEMEGKTYGENGQGIPVLTYEELAGLVLGYDPWDLGLQMHQTNCEPFLNKMGIQYSRELKYASKEGTQIGNPAMLSCGS
ncbi:MAG: heterodisulfide reductase-related iron-sulfur binding cluster [Prolixibacteraceae bacterium]|jgi:heterodisulfide reductase subunit B